MKNSALVVVGSIHVGGAEISQVTSIEADYLTNRDVVCVDFGLSTLLLTFADAALLVDKVTEALEARTSTLRVVA
ncbi:hypothetical protein ACGFQG_00795 [Nocardia fluminea]|uniref:hypothetical protein n=1 Tax=Nocardia fluminea TaxID=134984 RepID=UPI0037203399